MAKKENKKAKEPKKKKGEEAAPPVTSAPGAVPPTGAAPGADGATMAAGQIPLSTMSPEQMTAAQLEQAIKESNDPNNRLKKLRSPINVRSCLLNILILIVVTFGVVILWCYLAVDKFSFGTIMSDMMEKFGITKFFSNIGGWFTGLFS